MRTRYLRAMVILACVVLVAAIGAYPASAASLGISFPSSMFDFSRVQDAQPASDGTSNFLALLTTVTPGSGMSATQSSGIFGLNNNIGSQSLQFPSNSKDNSWMSGIVSSGVSLNGADNPALDSYDQLISRFSNQSNIFVY